MCATCNEIARRPDGPTQTWRDVPIDARLSDPRLAGRRIRVYIRARGADGSEGHLQPSIEGTYHGAAVDPRGGADLVLLPDPEAEGVREELRPHMREVREQQLAHFADPTSGPRHTWGPMRDRTHLLLVDGDGLPEDPRWTSTLPEPPPGRRTPTRAARRATGRKPKRR